MKELVEVIAKSLVDDPNQVMVSESVEGNHVLIQLQVASSDIGKVIGKQGRIAKAIRTVAKAVAAYNHKKVTVEIIE